MPCNGVRYTVPSFVTPEKVKEPLEVRFRVDNVYKGSFISVYFDSQREMHIKKRILTPGEMETVMLKPELFKKYPDCREITVKVEKE